MISPRDQNLRSKGTEERDRPRHLTDFLIKEARPAEAKALLGIESVLSGSRELTIKDRQEPRVHGWPTEKQARRGTEAIGGTVKDCADLKKMIDVLDVLDVPETSNLRHGLKDRLFQCERPAATSGSALKEEVDKLERGMHGLAGRQTRAAEPQK
jgi:hypothetical protein